MIASLIGRMDASPHPTRVRNLIDELLVEYGAPRNAERRESLLIHEGTYCGHRIRKGDFQAVWFIEEDQVKIFAPDGRLLDAVKPSNYSVDSQRAA
jgi:hypothetical protein